jgi:hypothetical protein
MLMQQDYFHGDITKAEAEDLLAGQPKGTYLVRVSYTSSRTSPFTISKVNSRGAINHQRILRRNDNTFDVTIKFKDNKTKTEISKDDMIVPFIKSLAKELSLENSCPGNKYKSLFLQTKSEGYLPTGTQPQHNDSDSD